MALSHKASRRGGPRPRLWIDLNSSNTSLSPASSPASSGSISAGPHTTLAPFPFLEDTDSITPTSSTELLYVLCLYDYDAEDGDQLSFRRNDILDVVKKEDTGWWAAIRPDNNRVGWIPSAFVEPISDALADKLRNSGGRVQIYHDDVDRLHGFLGDPLSDPFAIVPEDRGYDWMPFVNGDKVPIMQLEGEPNPPDIANILSPLVPPHEGIDDNPFDVESELSQTSVIASRRSRTLHSKEQKPLDEHEQVILLPPAPREDRPLPSTPRTPSRRRSLSLPCAEIPPSEHQRSRSESSKPNMRLLRRRPLLIDDQSSLTRLTTLFETHNVKEIEHLASPVVAQTFDAFKRTKSSDKIKQITGDDDAQAFHDAMLTQGTWYLRPSFGEHEIQLVPDGWVTAGTLRALVERLTLDFPKAMQEKKYRQAFLTTYKTFATAEEVFDLLVAQYNLPQPSALNACDQEQWKEKKLTPTRRRVLAVLQAWINENGLLQDDHYIARRVVDFVSSITTPPLANTAREILRSLERYISGIPPTPVSVVTPRLKKGKGSKSDLARIETLQLAEHLCMHEQRVYLKIRPHECLNWTKSQSGNAVRNIVAFNAIHEKLGSWVKMSILSVVGLGKRAETIDIWIKVAEKCKTLHNYASMHAIVSALASAVISRLHLTWAHVNRRALLEQLIKYKDSMCNASTQRPLQLSTEGPCIPYIKMYLADLQQVHEQHPDSVFISPDASPLGTTVSLINFAKRERFAEVIDGMLRHQAKPYVFAEDTGVITIIETGLAAAGERDQSSFWKQSQEIQQAEMQHADIRKGLELAGF